MTARTTVLMALLMSLWATPAAAQHAAPAARLIMHEQLVLLLNPMGAEHRLDLGVRREVGTPDDLLSAGSHIEGGVTTAVSPVYAFGGGYLQIQPFSFLVLRGELVGGGVWPIGMNGAGHYGVSGYDADVHSENLPGNAAGSAGGWMASMSATLQGAVDVASGWRLLLVSEWGLSRSVLGTDAHYYSMKYDLVLAREDFVVTGSSFLGAEARLASDLVVRFGAYDDFRNVPNSSYVGHQVGGLAMLEWQHITPEIGALAVFVRGGGYTHHVIREGEATILGGIAIDYELGGL
jgi:hypothetical protein